MRKIIVLTFLSLDGVMQAPGGPNEDVDKGFPFGGWTVPYFDDFLGEVMTEQLSEPFDLLLGRKTFDIFYPYWSKENNGENVINKAKKYVVSKTLTDHPWNNSAFLNNDAVEEIKKLKMENGRDLQVHGSGNLIQTLMKHDLVDEFWLKIFPVTLGTGKRLFAEGTLPAAFKLIESQVSPSGVIIVNYERAGEVKTGSF
ncbi:MAG: dihydrofolate reductase [Candidatus Moranbacteria bacterium]|nr:dihydrofolate reductase [Candidatus Moranbacteria bacterium]